MTETIRYLGAADIAALRLDPAQARAAVVSAFKAMHAGQTHSKPKLTLDIGPGHAFQSLCAASAGIGMAVTKWLGMAPASGQGGSAGIHAMIALNDFASGRLLAVLDGNQLTAIRTAAMSAAAAQFLARPESTTAGFIGCGLQARAHLEALQALLPGLARVRAFGRGRDSTERFLAHARSLGLQAEHVADAETVVRASEIVVTTVPSRPGLQPFLDPAWLAPGSFVAAVDVARSWMPAGLRQLDLLATDNHEQQAASPRIGADLGAMGSFRADLAELAAGAKPGRRSPAERAMFIFRGFALADLAVAACALQAAVAQDRGQLLPR